jgi:hypothetical protein
MTTVKNRMVGRNIKAKRGLARSKMAMFMYRSGVPDRSVQRFHKKRLSRRLMLYRQQEQGKDQGGKASAFI